MEPIAEYVHLHRAVEHLSRHTTMMECYILSKVICESPGVSIMGGTQKYEHSQYNIKPYLIPN